MSSKKKKKHDDVNEKIIVISALPNDVNLSSLFNHQINGINFIINNNS